MTVRYFPSRRENIIYYIGNRPKNKYTSQKSTRLADCRVREPMGLDRNAHSFGPNVMHILEV